MYIIRQLTIILGIACVGELIRAALPLPIPAGIYGFCILFICLMTGVVKLPQIKETSDYLVNNLMLFIIPTGVEFISYWDLISPQLLQFLIIGVLSTISVIFFTGKVADFVIDRKEDKN